MPTVDSPLNDARRILEEKLELFNVTDLRQELLPAIERIQNDAAVRFLILKHGRPQAVLMSSQTYDLVKRVLNDIVAKAEELPRTKAIEAAFDRLRSERSTAAKGKGLGEAVAQQVLSKQIEVMTEVLKTISNELNRIQAETKKVEVAG